jgi:dihydrofolate reductase
LNDLKKVVFSSSIKDVPWGPAVLIRENPVEAVSRFKKEKGKDMVIVGSGTLVSSLVAKEMIDEYRIRIRPIILGSGKTLFNDKNKRHKLKLISTSKFSNGVVALHYEPEIQM